MKTILVLPTLLSLCYGLQYGPCHPVTTVEVDNTEVKICISIRSCNVKFNNNNNVIIINVNNISDKNKILNI